MVLPSNYAAALTPGEQLFVLTDVERVDRGLPPVIGMVAQLDTDAQNAAAANTDPTPVAAAPGVDRDGLGVELGGGGRASRLELQLDVRRRARVGRHRLHAPANPGSCWGHRDNELGFNASQDRRRRTATLVMGAAEDDGGPDSPWTSDAMLLALDHRHPRLHLHLGPSRVGRSTLSEGRARV